LELPDTAMGFDKLLGADIVEASGDRVVMTCELRPDLQQPYGIVHGGVHCSLVESTASIGAALWFGDRGNVVGVANHTNFLRAAREGRLTATAEPIQRGRTQQLWRVTVTDDDGRNLAVGEVRLANIVNPEVLGRA
jgi:1,4-dihydroxy-2-naphthoyl-CoA hydrolase